MSKKNMNTQIHYSYHDKNGHTAYNHEIFRGTLTEGEKKIISASCKRRPKAGASFIPRQVGLIEGRFWPLTKADTPWYRFEGISDTDARITNKASAKEVLRRFQNAAGRWDEERYQITPTDIEESAFGLPESFKGMLIVTDV